MANTNTNKVTVINKQSVEQKRTALEQLKAIAPIAEEAKQEILAGESALAGKAQESGLSRRLAYHFASLRMLELKDKPTLILLSFENVKGITIICSKKANGAVSYRVSSTLKTNEGTEECPLTEEQVGANTLISEVGNRIGKVVDSYAKQVMDICRDWEDLYACAVEQKRNAARAIYERWEKKNS